MAKRDIVRSVASVTAAFTTWREMGRVFATGDTTYGEVGAVTTIGRIALKVTGATLAYAFTDCAFEWLFNAKDKVIFEANKRNEEETEDTPLEWECPEAADCIDDCESCDKYKGDEVVTDE